MRKWTYLVAALLMAGTTATFTGCIDTDEPEGITNLRGAKSELIKAQAAVELVEVEMQKAKVANQELLNKAQELANQKAEYDNQLKALDVKLKELKVELEQATNEAEKARIEAEIAESNKRKADAENNMALAAEKFKEDMLAAQEATARAQAAYDLAMEEIELAKLTLSDKEQQQVQTAQEFLASATETMNGKYDALRIAQTNYYNALVDPSQPTLAGLQAALKRAQIDVEKAEIVLNEQNNMLALAEDFDAASWDAKIKELDKKIAEYKSEQSKALYKVEETKTKPEYKAAEDKVTEKNKVKTEAETAYNKAAADSTKQYDTAKLYLKSYKSEPINAALKELFSRSTDFTSLSGYDANAGIFAYTFNSTDAYTQKAYEADLEKDEAARTSLPSTTLRTVEAWQKTVKDYTVDQNGVEWNEVRLAEFEDNADAKKKDYDKVLALWEISVKAVKGTATLVPTTDLKKVTDAYNTSYTALANAVTAYNTAYDKTYKVAYEKYVTDTKKVKEDGFYIAGLEALLAAESASVKGEYDTWSAGKKDAEKITKLEGYLKNFGKTAEIAGEKAKAATKTTEFYAIPVNLAALENAANNAGQTALTSSDDVKAALKALTKANTDVQTALNKVTPAIYVYENLAKTPYGQKLVNTLTLDDLTGSGVFYEDEKDKDGNLTGHKKALRSNISDDEFAKLSETKLDSRMAETALSTTSVAVFGSVFSDRLVEVTEAMVRAYIEQNGGNLGAFGALGAMMAANDDVQLCKDKIAAAKLIEPLIAQLAGVKTNLENEIKTNTTLMNPFITKADETRIALRNAKTEVKTAEEEKEALTAADQAEADKFGVLITDYTTLKTTAQKQIDGMNGAGSVGGTSPVTVESIIAYWKGEVAEAEKEVVKKKDAVALAEKRIELFTNHEDVSAYELQQKKYALDSAQAEYNKAKDVYDMAFAQLEALLAALTK